MISSTGRLGIFLCLAAAAVAGCSAAATRAGTPVVQPGAPGTATRTVAAPAASVPRHTEADVKFMQGMIGHHAQALEMTSLLTTRTARDDMRMLARRIDVSQTDEIRMMERWLKDRGLPTPDPHAHHMPGATLMPGMLTPEDMNRLSGAKGPEFDRLFLELMIKHHEGALVMVKQLFESAGAGQESDVFAFASDVEADQAIEIRRMAGMLAAMGR